ncbi:MAG TPA: TIM barrel protein, partial [Paracoccaceae bacterium]
MRFALNHIISPRQPLADFFAMARTLGCTEVEIRNDLQGAPIQDGTPAGTVRALAEAAGVTILSINALYPFNLWSDELAAKAEALADYAAASGARALVMCPLNEDRPVPRESLVEALARIRPILAARGLTGLVEPLGFPRSSLRTKAEAISAIREAGGEDTYKLVHDTFHHHLAGELEFYPDWTGLVHISGVTDPALTPDTMEDAHRVLVDADDRLGNRDQIRTLLARGYQGPFSFEPFAPEIQ